MKWKYPTPRLATLHVISAKVTISTPYCILASGLLSSLKVQLKMSADGEKDFRCKEGKDGKKSPAEVAGWEPE